MKTTTRIPAPIQAYTDDEGKPICGNCKDYNYCTHEALNKLGYIIPGPTCPVWGEGSKEVVE